MTAAGATLAMLPVEAIRPNPANRPEGSGRAEMSDLVASVRALGILEPLIVRPAGAGHAGYLLMAGERRLSAARVAGQLQVPAMVWRGVRRPEITDLLVILTENWQRVPMSAVEVARMLGKLNQTMTVARIAQLMGRRAATVYWYLELLKADEGTLARLERGEVTSGQVRTAIRAQIAPPPGHGRRTGRWPAGPGRGSRRPSRPRPRSISTPPTGLPQPPTRCAPPRFTRPRCGSAGSRAGRAGKRRSRRTPSRHDRRRQQRPRGPAK